MAPVQACFDVEVEGTAKIIDVMVDIWFGIDILVSFNTAFVVKDRIVVRRLLIAKRYLRSWFFLDFIAILPVQYFIQTEEIDRVNTLAKLPRLLRGKYEKPAVLAWCSTT